MRNRRKNIHNAASRGRRLGDYGYLGVSPNNEVMAELEILRNRMRQMRRDNPWIGRGINVAVANEIGTGIRMRADTGNDTFNAELNQLFADYADYADYNRDNVGVYGQQMMASRARRESGDSFLLIRRLRSDRVNKNLPVPVQFQLVESDQLPVGLHKILPNGNKITGGVETNNVGRVVAYHFWEKHPDEANIGGNRFVRIDASLVMHHQILDRPNQLRSKPELVRAILNSKDYAEYQDSELERKKNRSAFTGTIERDGALDADHKYDPITGEPYSNDDEDVPIVDIEPGSFPVLTPGDKIKLFGGDETGQGYSEYQKFQLLSISTAMDTPYQLISGDWSDINDRVWRAIFDQYKRTLQQVQVLNTIPQVCKPVWREFVSRAIATGVVTMPPGMKIHEALRATFKPQAFAHIHPLQDIQADIAKMQAGITSRQSVVESQPSGLTVEQVDAQRAIDRDREEALGLKSTANVSVLTDVDESDDESDSDDKSGKEKKDGEKK